MPPCPVTSTQTSPMFHFCADPELAFGDLALLLSQGHGQSPPVSLPCSTPSSQTTYLIVPSLLPMNHCWLSALLAIPKLASASCHQKKCWATGVCLLEVSQLRAALALLCPWLPPAGHPCSTASSHRHHLPHLQLLQLQLYVQHCPPGLVLLCSHLVEEPLPLHQHL